MNLFKKLYCRAFQTVFRVALPFLPYREPAILPSVADVPCTLLDKDIRSVLLVTDGGLRSVGLTAPLEAALQEAGIHCAVYDKTCANPTVANVEEARALYLKHNCRGLIAFGGGSPIDCAKAVGARIAYPKKSLGQLAGLLRVLRRIPTLIAIPTTAGTGSEVTLAAVITDGEKKHKYTINSFPLIPRYAVLDPAVTVTLPPHLTATTGMDALTHATEAYIGRSTTKETRRCALTATALIFGNIEKAYQNGKDLTARAHMLRAAYLAGVAFTKSYVGYIHAIAHSLGGQYNTPHGLANSVLMPVVLEAYGQSAHRKLHELGIAAGVAEKTDTHEAGARKYIKAIKALNRRMGIPTTVAGVRTRDIPQMARHADREANPLYPVPRLMNAGELSALYTKIQERSEKA